VRAVEPGDMDHVRSMIQREFGYDARFSHFPIVGLCAECAREGQGHSPTERSHTHD
jgi:Fur family ferric uptake transcriptional regulator